MPTVLLLDVSLSMSRPIPTPDTNESQTRYSLACAAINSFLDYLNVHAKLEYVSLVTYSSTSDVVIPFTRDFDSIRNRLPHIEEGDKTSLENALLGVNQLILNEWGSQTLVQIIIITDGNIGGGPITRNKIIQGLPLPSTYPAKINFLPIAVPHEACLQHAAVARLCAAQYRECISSLRCGHLEARVQLQPPVPAVPAVIHVIGFLHQNDLGTPITMSKHLVIPQPTPNPTAADNFDPKTPTKEGAAEGTNPEDDGSDPNKLPNFCVLLHGALKVESMSALVQLGPDCWGAVSAWCEVSRGRRSCLLLSVLQGGPRAAPWLGPLDALGPEDAEPDAAFTARVIFPIRCARSYSGGGGGGAAWARPHALLADVQKVMRHARKLPDKTQHLYKELNRLRRAAISLGFTELLGCVAAALERECGAPGASAPAETALQLAHAAAALRDPHTALDLAHTLTPRPRTMP